MKYIEVEKRKKLEEMFSSCEDSCIISALSGRCGEVYADKEDNPSIAFITVSEYSFIAGDASHKEAKSFTKAIERTHEKGEFNIRCVNNDFEPLVQEVYGNKACEYERFATVCDFDSLDTGKLSKNVEALPCQYTISDLDEASFSLLKQSSWGDGLVIYKDGFEEFIKDGLCVLIKDGSSVIAGASSYSTYPGGIEVEIVTHPDYRKKGLALICGSKLLLECKKKNLYASWDAAHEGSLRLAQRLGYQLRYKYRIFSINTEN